MTNRGVGGDGWRQAQQGSKDDPNDRIDLMTKPEGQGAKDSCEADNAADRTK